MKPTAVRATTNNLNNSTTSMNLSNVQSNLNTSTGSTTGLTQQQPTTKPILISSTPSKSQTQVTVPNSSPSGTTGTTTVNHVGTGNFASVAAQNAHQNNVIGKPTTNSNTVMHNAENGPTIHPIIQMPPMPPMSSAPSLNSSNQPNVITNSTMNQSQPNPIHHIVTPVSIQNIQPSSNNNNSNSNTNNVQTIVNSVQSQLKAITSSNVNAINVNANANSVVNDHHVMNNCVSPPSSVSSRASPPLPQMQPGNTTPSPAQQPLQQNPQQQTQQNQQQPIMNGPVTNAKVRQMHIQFILVHPLVNRWC